MAESKFTKLLWDTQQTSQWWITDNNSTQQTQWSKFQQLLWNQQTINAEKTLRESLKEDEDYRAFSAWQIKSRWKQIGNFFDNAWHTITDKDEDKWIKDYSEYKHYKTLLDGSNPEIDKTDVYKQMAFEWVIDYDKFTKWQEENKDNKTPFEDYKKAVNDIKESFSLSIEKTLKPFMSQVNDSYKLNALTKAAERMNNQFWFFIDWYAETYKDTRDEALLTDLNKIINEYTYNVNQFVSKWASHLINDNSKWIWAYYNTLDDTGMKDLANWIVKLEWQAEDKMAKAAIKSNFWDSIEALKKWNVISSVAELVWAAFNWADWVLNKVGDAFEEVKQTTMWWYDVVEELANLNVYSNDAWALEKAFGTMWSWVWSIVDAAPTIWPMALDIIFGTKTWLVKWVKQAWKAYRVAKTTKFAESVDDAINAIFKSKKSYKQIQKVWDIVLWSEEWSTFWVRWMKNMMDDIILFDLSFQQFEWHPLSDDNMALNMLFNLPFDALAAKLTEWGKFFKSWLKDTDLVTEEISDDMLKRFQKAYKWNKWEWKSVDVMAEEWYMWRSIETSYQPTKVWTKEQIKNLQDWEKLLEYIEKVQQASKWVWERLTTFQWVWARDLLLEIESQLTKANKNLTLNEKLEWWMKKLVAQNKFLNLSAQQISSKQIIWYLQKLVHNWWLDAKNLKKALERWVKEDDWFKEIIYSIMTDDVELFNKARQKVESSWIELSQTELSRRLNSVMWELININPDVVKVWDIVWGYVREWQDTWKNIFKDEVINTEVLLSRLRNMDTVDGFSRTENESMIDRIDTMIQSMWKKKQDVSQVFENTQVDDMIKTWDPYRWEWIENDVKREYRKDNSEQVALTSIMKKAWLNIKVQDWKFVIEWDKSALINLRKSFELMQGAVNINNLTGWDWVAYKIIFAKQYANMFNDSVNAINKLNASLWNAPLTQEEVLTLADNWTHWTDRLYKETEVTNELEEQIKKRELKAWVKADEINKAVNNSLDWNWTAIDVEQEACKAVINDILLNPKVLDDWNFDRQSLASEIKWLFKQRVKKIVKPWDGNRWYSTIREGEISIIDEETLDTITEKLIDVMETFKADSIEDKQQIYSSIANWFSVIAMTPQAANTLKEQWMDFYYTILSWLITKDPKVTTKYMKKMQSFIDETLEWYRIAVDNAKTKWSKIAEEYKYNGKVWNLKAWILQLQEWINEVKAYIENWKLKWMVPWIEWEIKSRMNLLTKNVFNSKDYKDWLAISKKVTPDKAFAEKYLNKTLDTNNLTDNDIDTISDFLARRGMATSWVISKKFYNNLYQWYKKWFDTAKQMWNFKIKIDEWLNRYSLAWWESIFWILEPAFVLWNIDNTNLASSIIVHELTHQQIFKQMRDITNKSLKWFKWKSIDKWALKADIETIWNKYFWWSMSAYIESLRNKLKETVKLSQQKWNENLNSFLYNYTNQYSKREILDWIIDKYWKENLINELINDYHKFDRSNINNYLWSIINNEYITTIEELITEYKTLLTIWEAWYKNVNAPYINKALDILMDAANTIDRYRVLCLEKAKYDDTALRTALSAEYTARDLAWNKSFEDNISDFISREIYSLKWWDIKSNDWIKYIYDIHKAMWVNNIDIVNQSPEEIKRKLIDSLDDSIRKAKNNDKRNSYYRLKWQIQKMEWDEVLSFLDITDSVYMSPYAEYNKILEWENKIYESGLEKAEWNYGTDIKNMSKLDYHIWETDNNAKVLITLLKQYTSNESVPVMNSLLSMSSELWGTNSSILNTVSKLIWVEWLPIDANKLLIWEHTSKLYDEYVKALSSDEAPMSFATFCTNKLVANVLSTYWLYSEWIVDLINKVNRENILSNVINNITDSGGNRQATDRVFKAMYNAINEQFWWDVFNYTSEEFIKKVTPYKLSNFNDKVKQYLYAQLQGWEVEDLEKEIKNAFLEVISSWEEALKNPLFKEWYAPKVLKWEISNVKKWVDLSRENAFKQYVNWLDKVDWRFKMNRNNALPQLLNIVQDMVWAKVLTVSKDKAKMFSESVLVNLDDKLFNWFMKDYYKLLNDMEWISDNYNQTLLYQHFIYKRVDKLADWIKKQWVKVNKDKYSKLKVYQKTQKDFNWILDEVSEESFRKYMKENPWLNLDAIYDEEWNYIVDATDDILQYNDDNQVINFAFRGEDWETTEKAETLRILQERSDEWFNDIISDDILSTINSEAFLDKLTEPYRVKYWDEYKIVEKEWSDLPINIWIYYNKARNADNINSILASNKNKIGNDLYNKLINFKRWVYDNSSALRVANNQWVEYILKSTINWTPVRKVTAQFGNWKKVAYILKDWQLKKLWFDDTLELLENINSSINWNMWLDIKFIWDKWDALEVSHLGKTQIRSSFIWEDVANEIWIYKDIVRDIDWMTKDEYRKAIWFKMLWEEWQVWINDVINSSKSLQLNKLVNNNDVVLQLIYWQLNYQRETLIWGINILNNALNASKWAEKNKIIWKLELANDRLNRIDRLKNSIKNQLPDSEYLNDPYHNTMDMLKSMEINDIPQFFNKNWKPWQWWDGDKYYRIVVKNEKWETQNVSYEKARDDWAKRYKKNIDITVNSNWEEISRELSKWDVWKPYEFRQKYKIIDPERKWLAITRPWEVVDEEKWLIVYEWTSRTTFSLDSDARWVRDRLNREEDIKNLWKSWDDFFDVEMVYDGTIPVIFKNETTWETFEWTIRKQSAVDQVHWTEFKRVILETDWENPFKYLWEWRDEIALSYNSQLDKRRHSNDVWQYQYIINEDWTVKFDYDKWDYEKVWKSNVSLWTEEYEKWVEAWYKTRMSQLNEAIPEARYKSIEWIWDRNFYKDNIWNYRSNKEDLQLSPEELAKKYWDETWNIKYEIDDLSSKKAEAKEANKIAETTNTYSDIENVSNAQSRVLAFTNYDILWNDTYLKYVRWRRNVLLNNKKVDLERIQNEWNKVTMNMSQKEQQEAIDDIKKTLWNRKLNNKWELIAVNPMGTETTVKYKQIINEFANVFADEWWYNMNILWQINSVNSIDDIIVKLHTNDLISTMGINADATSVNKARDAIYDWIRWSVKTDKEAKQIAQDFIWDPLGTWAAYKLLANTRAAYRFAKYWLLSPVSWAIMYANSAILWNMLLQWKKKWLEWYLKNSVFDEITWLDNVLSFLNRGDDLITNSWSDIENKWLFVNKMLNSIVNTVTKKWTKANQVLSTIVNWGYHSLYDLWHQWEVRKYAFAQALKQNRVYESQLPALLELLQSWKIMDNPKTSVLWSNIMAKTEENYARFFTNASTSSLSRHKRSRLRGFNFLQWYVINRTDEMMLWMRKWRDFVNQAWGFKNMTWDDITRHLAEDNVELKSFMNNIILSAKMAYYLDKAADADWTEAQNIRAYFIDTNDYLSSLDTVWFMRLLKAPLEWVWAYKTYSEWAWEEADMWWWLKVWVYESFAEVCRQFFREGKFLSAVLNPVIAAMQTWDIDFASTVAWVEWEKMANSLWRFGLVEWMEKYWLEDFSEDSDIIWQVLLNTDRSTKVGKETDDLYDISRVDSIINDPSYAAVTTIGYLPLIWELIKSATNNWWFNFSEAKYKKLMNMVENDADLKKLYKWELDVSLYSDEAINRLWTDFTSFNYPYKNMKSAWIHDVWSMFQWKDSTLNSMKEDVFVQNICEKMNIDIETFHKLITENWNANAKTTGKLKVIAAAEAAEPGSWKIVLWYMMANALYELEKEVSWMDYPSNADFTDEQMNYMKKVILNQYWNEMFTADKASWYKAVRELVSIKEPDVFNTLYKNETLNSYLWSLGFLDMLMRDAANKWDVNAKYIKNVFSVISKYMINPEARWKAIEHEFWVISELNTTQSVKNMAMEWILAGNIDYYNQIKNNPTLSVLYKDVLDSFEHRIWWVMDNVDIQNDSMKRQWNKKYTPYTSQYWNDNKKVDDDLKNKVGKYYNPLTWKWKSLSSAPVYKHTQSATPEKWTLDWYWKYYEELIKDYSDKLVKSEWKKYPAEWIENITFKTGSNNRWSIKWTKLEFPKHKSKEYRTNVISNLPGSHW